MLRFDLFIFVNILSLGYLDLQIRKRNNFDYRKILLFEYKEKRKDSSQKPPPKFRKKLRSLVLGGGRISFHVSRYRSSAPISSWSASLNKFSGWYSCFGARDSRTPPPPSLRRKKCYYWEVWRRKRNRVRRTRLNEGTFFALPDPIKISPV